MAAKKRDDMGAAEMYDLHDQVRKLTEERIVLKKRIIDLETQGLQLENTAVDWQAERATFQRQVANLTRENDDLLERLRWVNELTCNTAKNPLDLPIRFPRPNQRRA